MTNISIKLLKSAGPTLARSEHWQTRAYHQFLLDRARKHFAWGSQDCALFAADGILAFTGVDIASDFRGKYSTEAEAFAAVQAVCGGTTVADAAAYCASKHNLPEWQYPLMAQRGDLAVFEDPDTTSPGGESRLVAGLIHLNGRHIVAAGELGLKNVPIAAIKRAWHV
jgi:hypothetical protein